MASSKLSPDSILPLPNSSVRIPQLGFGVYQSPADVCEKSCLHALKSGYKHIDSAQYYANEAQVGHSIQSSKVSRDSIFLTTKILSAHSSVDENYQSIIESCSAISGSEGGNADLFLIHSPSSGSEKRRQMWSALQRAHREGRCKAIGVSNFGIKHIEDLKEGGASVWPPHVNQIELHPWCQQREIVEYCKEKGIVVEAYCPIVRNKKAEDPTLKGIAEKKGKTPNQVLIRWSLQKGFVPLPKSDTPSRIEENADVFGFELSESEMAELDGLDQGADGALVQAVKNDAV